MTLSTLFLILSLMLAMVAMANVPDIIRLLLEA